MDAALEELEFPAIAERLAGLASTSRGEELARGLMPSPEPEEVARRQALTAEAVALLDEAAEPPLERVADVREASVLAWRGGTLSPEALARVAATVRGGLALRGALEESAETAPLLHALAEPVERSLATLADEVERCVEEDGSDLRDTASPLLRQCGRSCARAGIASRRSCGGSRATRPSASTFRRSSSPSAAVAPSSR